MDALIHRIHRRIEEDVCPRCVHRTADGGCSLPSHDACPAFHWAEKLAAIVSDMDSPRLADYVDRIQTVLCPDCAQGPDGRCEAREHLDCPLDLYGGLIIPILEEELKHARARGE